MIIHYGHDFPTDAMLAEFFPYRARSFRGAQGIDDLSSLIKSINEWCEERCGPNGHKTDKHFTGTDNRIDLSAQWMRSGLTAYFKDWQVAFEYQLTWT